MVTTIAQINRETKERCQQYGLDWECGGDGKFDSEIAIVAEAPGDRERQMKIPLCGGSGNLLWNIIRPYGLSRRSVYTTNAIKKQLLTTNNDKYNKLSVGEGEAQLYDSVLMWELAQLPNLKTIVVLGSRALQAVTGHQSIMTHRGSVLTINMSMGVNNERRTVTVVCMFNPAFVMRRPEQEIIFRMDCGRLNKVIKGEFEHYEIKEHVNPTFEQSMAWIERMRTEGQPVSFDIETSSGEVICFGLANDPHEGMCIPLRTDDDHYFTFEQEKQLLLAIEQLVQDPNVRLVMQNGMYDSSYMEFIDRIGVRSSWFDTMFAHHTLYPTLPHNLGFLTTQYTTHPYYKDDGKLWKEGGGIIEEWRYNIKDVCITLKVAQQQLKELKEQKLDGFFFQHVMRLHPHLVQMTVLGVEVDLERRAGLSKEFGYLIADKREQFFAQVELTTGEEGYRPNPASPKQMAELYFKRLKLVGRGVKTDEENRNRMKNHPRTSDEARKLLEIIDELAKLTKFKSTYIDNTLDTDGKIRCEYKQTGVQSAPGRLSSASTGWGTGGNLQNQPDAAHQMYIAGEDCEFSYFDLAQAEARVVGWRYNIPTWIDQFERARTDNTGYDAHRALASEMFNMAYEMVPKEDIGPNGEHTIRYTAKRCRHGLNYRMMADRLATTLRVEFNQAAHLWALYHKTTPELQKGWEQDVKAVQTTKQLFNAYGRRWMLLQAFSDEATESVVAFYPQSTIGDKVSRAIYLCHDDLEWPTGKARICLNNHDALIAIHRPEVGETVRRIMKKHAEEPIKIVDVFGNSRELIIPADLKKSVEDELGKHRWANMVKVK